MFLLRSRFPAFYRLAAFVALLAILVPVETGLAHHPAAAQAFVHICGLDTHQKDDQGKDPAHKLPSCPICQSLHLLNGGFVPPGLAAIIVVPAVAATYAALDTPIEMRGDIMPQARPRAPPSLV